jgi:O-antigen/teichoic acid export membrane protein
LSAQLCQLPLQVLATLSGNLLLPFFSEHARNGGGADASIRRVRRLYLGLGTAMTLGLLLLGPMIANLLFGKRFGDAGWMVQMLAISVLFRSLSAIGADYLKALGSFRTHAVTNAVKVPVIFVMAPLLASYFGSPGLLAGFALADALRYAAIAYAIQRRGLPGLRDDIIALSIIAAASVAVFVRS